MAHNLEIINGDASMFYFGEAPWHRLGTKLDKPGTSKQAIEAANLNWNVSKKQIYLNGDIPVKNKFATVRDDKPNTILGIVGSLYTPLQNTEAFKFFDSIVGNNKAVYHTAGVLLDGKIVWILAKLPGEIKVTNEDITEKYLLLSNSHDGSTAVQLKFTPIRVVCNNTLSMAVADQKFVSVYHQRDIKQKLSEVPELLGIINKKYELIGESFKQLVKIQMSDVTLDKYLNEVFPDPKNKMNNKLYEYELAKAKSNREWSKYFFENGKGNDMKDVRGTMWAALNSITELVDHKVTKQSTDRKLNSIWFGDKAVLKNNAYNLALNMIKS